MKKVPLFEANKAPKGEEFEKFFKGSKVVDKSGKPLLMYHGGSYSGGEFKGDGWFTSSKADAKYYAKQGGVSVTKAYVCIKNPIYAGYDKKGKFLEANAAVLLGHKKGNDGMIDIHHGEILDAVIYNNSQIWVIN